MSTLIDKLEALKPLEYVCAWCQKEKGEEAKPNQSHGICQFHTAQVLQQLKDLGK